MADQAKSFVKSIKQNVIHVIFRKIEESYPTDADICINYSISGALEVSSKDWIGLYKVGWRSHTDYVYYEWSPYPPNYELGMVIENKVVFPASKLPKDDGEFYQFCYVASSGLVRGASTPFQFKAVLLEDFIEIEDENSELLVIRTKTSILEDKLELSNKAVELMKQKLEVVEKQLNILQLTEQDLQKKLQKSKENEDHLRKMIDERNYIVSDQKQATSHLQDCIKGLQEKIEVLKQEKMSMEKRLDDNDLYIASLQDKIKNLVVEKDSSNGKIKTMEDELSLLKVLKQTFLHDEEKMKAKMVADEMENGKLKKEIELAEKECARLQAVYEQQTVVNFDAKNFIGNLTEKLQNAEDKLSTAEHCKKMLNEEVLSSRQAYQKAVVQYETCQAELESLKNLFSQLEVKHLGSKEEVEEKLKNLTSELEAKTKIVLTLEKDLEQMEKENSELRNQDRQSVYALEMAHATLSERYVSISKKYESMQKAYDSVKSEKTKLETCNAELTLQTKELAARTETCFEQYKQKCIECDKLEDRLSTMEINDDKRHNYTSWTDLWSTGSNWSDPSSKLKEKSKKYKAMLVKELEKNKELEKKLQEKEEECNKLTMMLQVANVTYLSGSPSAEQKTLKAVSKSNVPTEEPLVKLYPCLKEPENIESSSDSTSTGTYEEEKFVDAPNEPITRSCPFCPKVFGDDWDDVMMHSHIDVHFSAGVSCPICEKEFGEGYPEEELIKHVDTHF